LLKCSFSRASGEGSAMSRFCLLCALCAAVLVQPVRADVLVMVHGYMSDASTWEANGVTQALAVNGWQPAGVMMAGPGGVLVPAVSVQRPVAVNRTYSVNLPAAAPLQVQAMHLATAVAALRQSYPGERLILAGHSAGGVVARMLVIGNNPYGVDTLVTIASPHLGTARAAQGLDVVDSKPFFCPGPGIRFLKSLVGGRGYDYLEHSRGALVDLLPAESGNVLAWLNQQPHPDIRYVSVVRGTPGAAGDSMVPAYSQDMNNVPALRGRVTTLFSPAGHGLNPADGQLLAQILAGSTPPAAARDGKQLVAPAPDASLSGAGKLLNTFPSDSW
jgi:pimeloyl-ACP methyl ester carboxylesterase